MHPIAVILWTITSCIGGGIVALAAHLMGVDNVLMTGFCIGIFASTGTITRRHFEQMFKAPMNPGRRQGIDNFRDMAAELRVKGQVFSMIHLLFGTVGVVASCVTSAKASQLVGDNFVQVSALVAAICTGLLAFYGADKRAARFSEAASKLQTEIGRYDIETSYTFDHVAKVHGECLNLVQQK